MSKNIFIGFDGYIDRIMKPVRRKKRGQAEYIATMKDFADYIAGRAGTGFSLDMETQQVKIGGNMPNMAYALSTMGFSVTCLGAMGYPEVDRVFAEMQKSCRLLSVAEPGICDAVEFTDGKIMLGKNESIDRLDYACIRKSLSLDDLIDYLEKCDAAAFLNWGEMICSNDIWKNLAQEVLPRCRMERKKYLLIDFSDFSHREPEETQEMLHWLSQFRRYFSVVVSLNENELKLMVQKVFGRGEMAVEEGLQFLSEALPCDFLAAHLLESAKYPNRGGVITVPKKVSQAPFVLTGGGDNFNAGLLAGLTEGMTFEISLELANLASWQYVEKGRLEKLEIMKEKLKKRA